MTNGEHQNPRSTLEAFDQIVRAVAGLEVAFDKVGRIKTA